MIWFILWYLVGAGSIFLACWFEDDILYTDIPIMLIVSILGPILWIPIGIDLYEKHREKGTVFIRGYDKGKD